jgi:hypothetical protein
MKRALGVAALVLGLAAVPTALAAAVHVRLEVSPTTVAAGGRIRVFGNAAPCRAGSTVIAISQAFPGHAYGKGTLTGRVTRGGNFSITGHVRSGLHRGRYVVGARCGGGNLGVSAYIHIS